MSNRKLIVKKFFDIYNELADKDFDKKQLSNGIFSIDVDCHIKMKFLKAGRSFDGELIENIK